MVLSPSRSLGLTRLLQICIRNLQLAAAAAAAAAATICISSQCTVQLKGAVGISLCRGKYCIRIRLRDLSAYGHVNERAREREWYKTTNKKKEETIKTNLKKSCIRIISATITHTTQQHKKTPFLFCFQATTLPKPIHRYRPEIGPSHLNGCKIPLAPSRSRAHQSTHLSMS